MRRKPIQPDTGIEPRRMPCDTALDMVFWSGGGRYPRSPDELCTELVAEHALCKYRTNRWVHTVSLGRHSRLSGAGSLGLSIHTMQKPETRYGKTWAKLVPVRITVRQLL